MAEETQTLTVIEAINEFYRLKDKYESEYNKKYVVPIVKRNISNKAKRLLFSKLLKPECINCKRTVGTIFTIKNDTKEDVRNFVAKCGDLAEPCPLEIQINYSVRDQLYNSIIDGSKDIEAIKLDIIKEKNKALFFNKDVVASFEKLTSDLKLKTEIVGFGIETNILRNYNPEKYALIKKNIDEFGKGFILPFKQLISNYMDTENELVLNESVKFYVDEMVPKLKEIQEMKYSVNFVEYNLDDNTYTLIQYPNSLEDGEFFLKNDDKIVKFIKGVKIIKGVKKEKKSKNSKTMKNGDIPKNKTKKLRPDADLIKDEDAIEIIAGNEADIIGNNKKEYDEVWSKMPDKLKEYLETDKQWLEEYMHICINAKQKGKPCLLFLPRQTQFPPTVLADGTYDFKSELVNTLFNSLDPSHQKRLLTLFSVKDGIANYDMLKNALIDLLTKNLINYNKGYL
jgi:hypothetical protein